MSRLDDARARIDQVQRRHIPLAFLVAVQKKVGDDRAGSLIANLAYSAFVTVFPLLLLLVTLLGAIVGANESAARAVEHGAFSQFPILGDELQRNIHALNSTNVLALVVGIVGLIWGTTGLAQTGLFTMAQIWYVPDDRRPNFWKRLLRSLAFLVALGLSVSVSGFLSGLVFATTGGRGIGVVIGGALASALVNIGAYLLAFRILTPAEVPTGRLLWGALVGGIVWTVVEAAGTYLVGHQLRHSSQVYGFFGVVLGLMAWLYLGSRIAVYAAETNVVLAHRLWPRSLAAPATEADAHAGRLAAGAVRSEREPARDVR